jgi:hypothetical protein
MYPIGKAKTMTLKKMTPRQRAQTALNHNEPDRVPFALGSPYAVTDFLAL